MNYIVALPLSQIRIKIRGRIYTQLHNAQYIMFQRIDQFKYMTAWNRLQSS